MKDQILLEHSFAEGPQDYFDEACVFCKPSDEDIRKGVYLGGENGLSSHVFHSKVSLLSLASTFCDHHHGGYLYICFTTHGYFNKNLQMDCVIARV